MSEPEAAVCGACGERQVRLQRAVVGEDEDAEEHESSIDTQRVARCLACGHQPSEQVFRENRLEDLLPDEWPDDTGVVWSENLPDPPEGQDAALLLVLGPREWDALSSRASLEFREGVDVEVVKGRGPGVGFTTGDGEVGGVEVHLPGEAVKELHQTGRWSASVGPSLEPVHVKVVVLADA